jgi:hypothetical protein
VEGSGRLHSRPAAHFLPAFAVFVDLLPEELLLPPDVLLEPLAGFLAMYSSCARSSREEKLRRFDEGVIG